MPTNANTTLCARSIDMTPDRLDADWPSSIERGEVPQPIISRTAFAGYHMRKRLSRELPDLGAAVLEDALAIGGGILIIALAALG